MPDLSLLQLVLAFLCLLCLLAGAILAFAKGFPLAGAVVLVLMALAAMRLFGLL